MFAGSFHQLARDGDWSGVQPGRQEIGFLNSVTPATGDSFGGQAVGPDWKGRNASGPPPTLASRQPPHTRRSRGPTSAALASADTRVPNRFCFPVNRNAGAMLTVRAVRRPGD